MTFMTQREEDLQRQVDKLVGMIETVIFKHPHTSKMFKEELILAGAWPMPTTEKNNNTQTQYRDGDNERAAEEN